MIDNSEIQRILEKLEGLEDEVLAVELLKEFNEKTKVLGELLLNQDKNLVHEDWKRLCDEAKKAVDVVLEKIDAF